MTFGAADSDPRRIRLGLVFLAIGVMLLAWAWGNWMFRASMPLEDAASVAHRLESDAHGDALRAARWSPAALMLGFLLVLVFLVGSYAIVRGSRRFREALFHVKPRPSAADDVWAMHKPPTEPRDTDD